MKIKTKNTRQIAFIYAILSAFTYGISFPLSKILLMHIPTFEMTALLYTGAGLGMLVFLVFQTKKSGMIFKEVKEIEEDRITKKDFPTVIWMIILNLAASAFLLMGIHMTSAATVSLLSNFEIVATTLIARLLFKEILGRRVFWAILFIFASSVLLSINESNHFELSLGAFYVLLACICWGAENNTTAALSTKNPVQVVVVKSLATALFAFLIALMTEKIEVQSLEILSGLVLGFVSYGLSLYFYVYAQRHIGAIRTGAYFAIAPFIGLFLSWLLFGQALTMSFTLALLFMVIGGYLVVTEK
ncbi:MAG: DMT family transporter [Streptococcaceae bacterium]|jgi:drug/metabolite transporter (DMT)-like permease|nr:DMT family transporter [Streptococcaceae bacterium]